MEDIEKEIAAIRKLTFSYSYSDMIQKTYDVLAKLSVDKRVDQNKLRNCMSAILMAMEKQDYLLIADILTYEILPLRNSVVI